MNYKLQETDNMHLMQYWNADQCSEDETWTQQRHDSSFNCPSFCQMFLHLLLEK
jgi:hypothetical protein